MWWHTRRNQIRYSSEMDESNYIGGGVSSVEYWLSWSAGRQRTIIVTLDGLFRVKLKTAGYPLHSPLSSSLLHPCVTVCHHIPFPLYLNQLRHFVFFSPPTIILWYYCTVQLNHITYCPFHSSHSQPITPHCTTCLLTAVSLCVPEVLKCVYFRFISTGFLCHVREFYQLDMTT